MFIPIRPGEYSRLDQLDGLVDDHPTPPFPPVSAGKAALAKELHQQVRAMECEARAERRAELRLTLCVAAFIIVASGVSAGTEWAVYMLAVHS